MSLQNSGERQIIFLLSQYIQENEPRWLLAGSGALLVFLFFLLFWSVCRRKRRNSGKEPGVGPGHITGDTAEMPGLPDVWLEHYGFRVVEDITYIHTGKQIIQEEEGIHDGMDNR